MSARSVQHASDVIWWCSCGEIVFTRGRDSAANPNLILINSEPWAGNSAVVIRAKAMSSVKKLSGVVSVVVTLAGVSLAGTSLFLAVDAGLIAVSSLVM